jgi:hypothetical protein
MSEPLENLYFNWLCAKVTDLRTTSPGLTHWELFRTLHRTEFVWLLSGDDNRAEDGKELRREFIIAADLPDDPEWRLEIGCSVLEMLIAFSRRASYMTDVPAVEWFWEFLDNLGLKEFTDNNVNRDKIIEIVDHFIWRTYDENGNGGLFPILTYLEDQRTVEVWYQFCAYLMDRDRLP